MAHILSFNSPFVQREKQQTNYLKSRYEVDSLLSSFNLCSCYYPLSYVLIGNSVLLTVFFVKKLSNIFETKYEVIYKIGA